MPTNIFKRQLFLPENISVTYDTLFDETKQNSFVCNLQEILNTEIFYNSWQKYHIISFKRQNVLSYGSITDELLHFTAPDSKK